MGLSRKPETGNEEQTILFSCPEKKSRTGHWPQSAAKQIPETFRRGQQTARRPQRGAAKICPAAACFAGKRSSRRRGVDIRIKTRRLPHTGTDRSIERPCVFAGGDDHAKRPDWTHRMPDIARALAGLPVENALVDGEVVVFDDTGATSFAQLQAAFQEGKKQQLTYVIFDLLH